MSHLSLNQQDLLQIFEPQTELDFIIRHYEIEFEQRGEVICQIRLNNLNLSEEDEQRFRATPLALIHSLEMDTEDPNQLFHDVLTYWRTQLPSLIKSADRLSMSLRFKSIDQNAVELSQFIDQSHLLVNSLNSISSICIHKDIVLPPEWSTCEKNLWKAFNELLDSFNDRDTTTMAEVIEYDLANALQTWLEVLSKINL